jgi:hypothetical protein
MMFFMMMVQRARRDHRGQRIMGMGSGGRRNMGFDSGPARKLGGC